jgi:hypothetical protein
MMTEIDLLMILMGGILLIELLMCQKNDLIELTLPE